MRRRRLTVVLVAATTLVVAATALAWTARALTIRIELTPEPAHTPTPLFTMTGEVGGLFPGAVRQLPLRVHNTHAVTLDVTRIDIDVKNASAACRAALLSVQQFRGHLRVPARSTVVKYLTVRMASAAGQACQGATFPLQYNGFGRPAP